jgi:hypothetical protein
MGLQVTDVDRWAVPLLAILGALGLAAWSIYWDLRRRIPLRNRPNQPALSARSGTAVREHRLLEGAIVLLTLAWLLRYFSTRWGAWLAVAGYGTFVAAIGLLTLHVARRLSALQREPDGD